ncbi:hypothetical protein ACUP6R_003312 [Vibrio navarrensis]
MKNRLSISFFFFICISIYFMPLFFGVVNEPSGRYVEQVDIVPEFYLIASFIFFLCPLSDFIYTKLLPRKINIFNSVNNDIARNNVILETQTLSLIILILISFILQYVVSGPALLSADKSMVLEAKSRWTTLNTTASMIALCFLSLLKKESIKTKHYNLLLFFTFISLAFNIYIGHRSNAAIAFLGVCIIFFIDQRLDLVVRNNKKKILLVIAVSFFFFIYKFIYIAVKMNDFQLVAEKLASDDFFVTAFTYSEPFTTQGIFNRVISDSYIVECSNIAFIPVLILPAMNEYIDLESCKYNYLIQRDLFPEVDYGVGSNIWAEFFSLGGYFSLFTLSVIFLICLICIYHLYRNVYSILAKSSISVALVYICFYSNRKDLFLLVGILKRIVLTLLIIYVISFIIRKLMYFSRWR